MSDHAPDRAQVDIAIAANPSAYASRNSKIEVADFDVNPRRLSVSLALRAEAEFESQARYRAWLDLYASVGAF